MRISLSVAIDEAAARDPVLANLVALAGPIRYPARDPDGRFGSLVRAIVYQQLAEPAAHAIYGRVRATVDVLTPAALAAMTDDELRAAGLSRNKVASIRDLSAKVLDGTVDLERSSRLSDDELMETFAAIRGIGPWTTKMYMMFELRRLDVWPVEDLGVRRGYGLAWGLDPSPSARELTPLGDRFRPYRSVLARYCWAAIALFNDGIEPALSGR
jgi:3-methyladenine DNA glycosylase/8-oxoguanine DNA glycosylase